jgi:protein-S-isoprenylcysteine O-methyltransferase Ste14
MRLKELVGSGDKIWLFVLPVLAPGLVLNVVFPAVFRVGGPPPFLEWLAIPMLASGVATLSWSIGLILTKARKGALITTGPYALVKHPIYTSGALLLAPSIGLLLDSWLGVLAGIVFYIGSRKYAPEEEIGLAKTFGPAWDAYCRTVKLPRF